MGHATCPSRWTAALLAALALFTASCSVLSDDRGAEARSPVSTLPTASTMVRVASGEWPRCLNPLTCTDDLARTLVLQHVLPRLMELDADGRYVPSPVLADAPEVRVDDQTGDQTIVFVLDEAARWHDGRPITSSDVRGTWRARVETPDAATPGHALITAVDDTDPLVARVTLSEAWADWPELFGGYSGWLLQADAFGPDADLTGDFDDSIPFGAGPYELVSFEERSLVLVARERHWDPDRQAQVDQVRIDHFPGIGGADASDAGVPGSIDLVIPGGELPSVPARFAARRSPEPAVVGLLFDRRTAPLGSFTVRAAVEQALDRRELVGIAGVDPEGLVPCLGALPGTQGCDDDLAEEGSSVAGTDALLEIDGWVVGADGRRARPDLPLATPVSYDPTIEGAEDIAEAVVGALVARGFTASAEPVPAQTWARRDRTEGLGIGVYASPLDTARRVAALYGCSTGSVNPLAWCDPEAQEVVQELLGAADPDERAAALSELSALAAETLSWLPLHQRTTPWLVDPDRIAVPGIRPLGSGPLGTLHRFVRADR